MGAGYCPAMSDFQPPGGSDTPNEPWARPVPPPPPAPPPYPSSAYGPSYGPTYGSPYAGLAPQFSSLAGLTNALTVLFVIGGGAALLAAIAFFNRASVLDDFGFGFDLTELSDADNSVRRAMVLVSLTALASLVVVIIWQFRHAQNAERLRGPLGLGPGWAIGGWFIPIGSMFLPGMQIGQAAKASGGRLPLLVPLWVVLFDIAFVFYAAGSTTRPGNDELITAANVRDAINDFQRGDRLSGVAMLFGIAACVAGIAMVRALAARQQQATGAR